MKTIHELTQDVQVKIAAGEVIERPAYIVKELIDNAIDAQSKKIIIHIEDGGLGKIMVSDDGIGMSREDLMICFKRYTTSKLKSVHDLSKIKTMGFRGEALSSISAVSSVTIRSRSATEESGGEVIVEDGFLKKNSIKGIPVGTQVIVENIFSKLPGRQKFLRSKESEYRLILEIITHFVLAFPHIRFEFASGKSKIFLFPVSDFENRVKDVVSSEIFPLLIPFKFEKDYIKVSGYISKPQLTYRSTRNIFTFLNNRFIHESYVFSLVKESYGSLLEPARYPHAILFLTIPHQLVDVNVHPRKETVHFMDMEMVRNVVQMGIKDTLETANLRFLDRRWNHDGHNDESWQIRGGGTKTETAKLLKKDIIEKNKDKFFSKSKHYFQLHNLYIATDSDEGILFFDQHAVHERILYEQLYKKYNESIKQNDNYNLISPCVINLTASEKSVLTEYKEILFKFGFAFNISENKVELTQIPFLLKDYKSKVVIKEIMDELIEKGNLSTFESIPHKMLAYLSCRGAVKAGDILSEKQCKNLLEELQKTENPYTCPHGRPTQVEIDINYFHKLFRRM
jgi:DNA mismatch repair protein MutL